MNTATLLTWLRIALIPAVIGVFYLPETTLSRPHQSALACIFFVLAALTDWLDGYIARAWNQSSAFGAFLDPVADKLMVTAALLMLLWLDRVDAALAFIIVGRELTISALREWMASMGARNSVAVNSLGKFKTIAQMVAIPMLLYENNFYGLFDPHSIGTLLLWIAAALTVASMLYYFKLAYVAIKAANGVSNKA